MADIIEIDQIQMHLLEKVADLHEISVGAYNIKASGRLARRVNSTSVEIVSKEDGTGTGIHIKPGTERESVHTPVVLSQSSLAEIVCNDFHVGDDMDVVIVAGYGIHSDGDKDSKHDGAHRFFLGRNAKMEYVEKHYDEGNGQGKWVLNPGTEVIMEENSCMGTEMVQIKGVDFAKRNTTASPAIGVKLIIRERLLTRGSQDVVSGLAVSLNGDGSSANVISRSVTKDDPSQASLTKINGNAECTGYLECDVTIMGNTKISTIPRIIANNADTTLIYGTAAGGIAGGQLAKLMMLGLTEVEVEVQIVNGFSKQVWDRGFLYRLEKKTGDMSCQTGN